MEVVEDVKVVEVDVDVVDVKVVDLEDVMVVEDVKVVVDVDVTRRWWWWMWWMWMVVEDAAVVVDVVDAAVVDVVDVVDVEVVDAAVVVVDVVKLIPLHDEFSYTSGDVFSECGSAGELQEDSSEHKAAQTDSQHLRIHSPKYSFFMCISSSFSSSRVSASSLFSARLGPLSLQGVTW